MNRLTSGPGIRVALPVAVRTRCLSEALCAPYLAAEGPNWDGTPPVSSDVLAFSAGGNSPAAPAGDQL
jgi:hypothetical protein